MNCEKIESVTSHNLYPSPVTNCHTFSDPLPPLERDILYGRPHITQERVKWVTLYIDYFHSNSPDLECKMLINLSITYHQFKLGKSDFLTTLDRGVNNCNHLN